MAICALCLQDRELRDSHLIPKAAYKMLRSKVQKNPNPAVVGRDYVYKTSRQIRDYVLCDDCEQRFNERGEKWVLGNCYRDKEEFKLRDILANSVPFGRGERMIIYAASQIPEFKAEDLLYFAMSVYWRAAVHRWRSVESFVKLELGPFLEPIRLFLLDQQPFPEHLALAVRVYCLTAHFQTFRLPHSEVQPDCHAHEFSIPGVTFMLLAGRRLPSLLYTSTYAPCPERFITFYPEKDVEDMNTLVKLQAGRKLR